jgi:hypothetical protein
MVPTCGKKFRQASMAATQRKNGNCGGYVRVVVRVTWIAVQPDHGGINTHPIIRKGDPPNVGGSHRNHLPSCNLDMYPPWWWINGGADEHRT